MAVQVDHAWHNPKRTAVVNSVAGGNLQLALHAHGFDKAILHEHHGALNGT